MNGKFKIFCHFFNNEKSRLLRIHLTVNLGKTCEWIMCIFLHDEKDASDTEEEEESGDSSISFFAYLLLEIYCH